MIQCDLSSLKSVKSFAADFTKSGKQCHVLIANAGVMSYPFALSADNHELIFSTNHLGHFLLVNELLPVLKRTGKESGANSRVVVLSSSAHFQPYKAEVGGPIRFDAIDSSDGYDGHTAYVSLTTSLTTCAVLKRLGTSVYVFCATRVLWISEIHASGLLRPFLHSQMPTAM